MNFDRRAALFLSLSVGVIAAGGLSACGGESSASTPPPPGMPAPPPAGSPPPPAPAAPFALDVSAPPPPVSSGVTPRLVTFTTGLAAPWGMAFIPDDGRLLVTQKAGSLVIVSANGQSISAPLTGVPAVDASGQGGLLDVAVDPQFATNRRVYLAYSELVSGANGTAVARGTLNAAATGLDNVEVIFRQAPKKTGTSAHYGSRLVFRGDGTLFVTLGERSAYSSEAQSLTSQLGKVVRINPDGTLPGDNPFAAQGGAAAAVWSLGHRNPQAAALHPATGELWVSEHGPQGGDEVNLALAARNFGWPNVSYGCNYRAPVGAG